MERETKNERQRGQHIMNQSLLTQCHILIRIYLSDPNKESQNIGLTHRPLSKPT